MSIIKCCGARWDSKINTCPRCEVSFIKTLETNLADAVEALEKLITEYDLATRLNGDKYESRHPNSIISSAEETLNKIKGTPE